MRLQRQILMAIAGIIVVSPLAGCARAAVESQTPSTGGSEVLRREEIMKTSAATAFDAVRLLRPNFLRSRGRTSILRPTESEPVVYLDDREMGGLAALREVQANTIFEIRYLTASQAQLKFGTGHAQGAIMVVTARMP